VGIAVPAPAQSGRKPPERKWATKGPEPSTETPPIVRPEAKAEKPEPSILVTAMKDGLNFSIPNDVSNAVLAGCVSALNTLPGVAARGAKDGSRKDAIDTAKSETKAYTLWIGVDADSMASGSSRYANTAAIATYFLYNPTTGKTARQGRVYMNYRYGLGQPRGIPGVVAPRAGGELYPVEAGEEIARRIADALKEAPPTS
jgi:hypothetical protein